MLQGGAKILGDHPPAGEVSVRQHHRKFLAADPRDDVVFADYAPAESGKLLEDKVAGRVTIGIIDILKKVEVKDHERHRKPVPPAPLYLCLCKFKKCAIICKARQIIRRRKFYQLGLCSSQLSVQPLVIQDHIVKCPDDREDDERHKEDRLYPVGRVKFD